MTEAIANPWENREAALLYDRIHQEERDVPLLLELARNSGGPILEIGCGTGRCLIPFIRSGYDTVGLEPSDAMLEVLRLKLGKEPEDVRHRATPLQGDGRDFSIPLRFGLTFVGRNSFCHFLHRDEQESFAANAFKHLRPGGILVVDVFNPDLDLLLRPVPLTWSQEGVTVTEHVIRIDFANQLRSLETIVLRENEEVVRVEWPQRYCHRFELELILEKCAFEITSVWGGYDRQPFVDGADRLIVVARKPAEPDMTALKYMRTAVMEPA